MVSLLTARGAGLGRCTALLVLCSSLAACRRAGPGEGANADAAGAAVRDPATASADAATSPVVEVSRPGDPSSRASRDRVDASRLPAQEAALFDGGAVRAHELRGAARAVRHHLALERPVDLGAATPLAVSARGVIFRQNASELVGARLTGSPAEVSARAALARREADGGVALRFGPPVVTRRGQSYWIARGKLLRRAFDWSTLTSAGDVETLASDALDGARVRAASADDAVDLVAYIARASGAGEERRARLWSTGAGAVDLSESGAGASSVALAGAGEHWVAVWVDARAAMSPVHGRSIEVAGGATHLGADVVMFVGPSPEGLSEVNALAWPEGLAAFIPFARDTTAFGLAVVAVGSAPQLDAKVAWTPYPNGIEPAPVDSAVVCGAPWVAYVRPRTAAPDAPAVLALGEVVDDGVEEQTTAAEGYAFFGVSLAAREGGGAWLGWVANGRSWVRGVACR